MCLPGLSIRCCLTRTAQKKDARMDVLFSFSRSDYSPTAAPLSTKPYFAGFFAMRPAAIIIGT